MGFLDKLKRQPKKSFEEQIVDTKVALKGLERRYNNMIGLLAIEVRENGRSAETVTKLKTAYYSLQLVKTAQRRMNSVSTSHELTKCLNETAVALKGATKLDDKGNAVNVRFLQRWTRKLNEKEEAAATGGTRQVYEQPIDALVEDEVVERLIKGESLRQVMEHDPNTRNAAVDMFNSLDIGDGLSSDMDINFSDLSDLIDNV